MWFTQQIYRYVYVGGVNFKIGGYVDDKTNLAPNEQAITPAGRNIKTIRNKWSYLQTNKFQANSQPFYVLLDPNSEQTLVSPQGADYGAVGYLKFLDAGLSVYHKMHP